jgi:8-hydroxy-5-deazaflavin:NADPH oxidoreductase
MNIGIIGAGNVGRALSQASVRAGHAVTISAADPEEARQAAQPIAPFGAPRAALTNEAAVAGADIVILAVPFDAISSSITELGSEIDGKVLVDVTNRFAPEQLDGTSNAERTHQLAPNATVVKAFNTIFAVYQADPAVLGIQLDGFVASDDDEAKRKVLELVASTGFRPIDAGPLAMARALEGTAVLNIWLNTTNGWPWQTAWKLLGPTG